MKYIFKIKLTEKLQDSDDTISEICRTLNESVGVESYTWDLKEPSNKTDSEDGGKK